MSNMSHLPSFLTTDPNDDLAAPVAEPNPGAFAWPTPPYAIYPTSLPQQEPEPCEIEGQNGKVMQASLLAYLPAQNVIQLVVPPARKAMALRPNRFRRAIRADSTGARPPMECTQSSIAEAAAPRKS